MIELSGGEAASRRNNCRLQNYELGYLGIIRAERGGEGGEWLKV